MKKTEWPRYDPSRGYMLCEACWNYRHFSFSKDEFGKTKRKKMCQEAICDCPCTGRFNANTVRFTGEGQMKIDVPSMEIGKKS